MAGIAKTDWTRNGFGKSKAQSDGEISGGRLGRFLSNSYETVQPAANEFVARKPLDFAVRQSARLKFGADQTFQCVTAILFYVPGRNKGCPTDPNA